MKSLFKLVVSIFFFLVVGQVCAQQFYFEESTPEAQGVSSTSILEFVDRLESEIDAVHSYMLLRNGKLISKGWWDPYDPETPHVMHSLSKSFTSTAVGFAVQEGLLSLDDLVISFFPDKAPEEPTWHWNEMRVRDLLTMNTGHLEEPWALGSEDWVTVFLNSEVKLLPGSVFKYNSMATYMLSAIVQKVSGQKLVDYLDERFFQPLQIQKPDWDEDPMGINTGGWGLHIRTEDIAKLGQFYLQKGMWDGERLLSAEWVDMATSKQVNNGSNPDNDWAQGYGFQFWRCRYDNYRGDGANGQFCIVMPGQNAVLAITAGTHDMAGIMNITWETLLPAMQAGSTEENEAAQTALLSKSSALELQPIQGATSSAISKKVSKRVFSMDANEGHIASVRLKLHGKEHSLELETEEGNYLIPVGRGKYAKTTLTRDLPYLADLEQKIGASGAWTGEMEYTLRIYFYETPARVTYTFAFDDGYNLAWTSDLEFSLFHSLSGQQLVPLSGKAK